MQWLAAVCVRRPVFTWVLILSLVVVGFVSIFGLGVDRFPDVDFPAIVVTTVLPGAAPEQVETEVSDKIEEQLNSIAGLEILRSSNYEGLSVVFAQFVLEKNTDEAAQDVRDKVNLAIRNLPDGTEQPQILRFDPAAAPIALIALRSTRTPRETTEYATRVIRRRLQSLDGVGGVSVLGGRDRQINVILDPTRLESHGLTVLDVQRALAAQNVEIPGGDVDEGAHTIQLRVQGRVRSVAELGRIGVVTRNGLTVHVDDVARVEDGETEQASAASLDDQDVVILAVRKQTGTNTVAIVDAIKERVDEISRDLPSAYHLEMVRDESEFIRNAIHAVEEHLVLGSIFAALVVLFFLWNGRTTVISALAIPTSIVSTFALINAMHLTLNTITLLALTLAVGIVIDDAIVVLENIVRFVEEKGMPPRRAAVLATREIGLAVLATTLSLIAVFLPVAFMGGIVGRFMKSFGFTMSFAIGVSLLVSFTLTPMLASRWLRGSHAPGGPVPPEQEKPEALDAVRVDPSPGPDLWPEQGGFFSRLLRYLWTFAGLMLLSRPDEREAYGEWQRGTRRPPAELASGHGHRGGPYGVFERGYLRVLAWCMRFRGVVGLAMMASVASIVPLAKVVQKNFLPIDDESRFEVSVRAPEGTSLEAMRLVSNRIARMTRALPGVAHTVTTVGSPPGDASGRGPNQSSIFVKLVEPTARRLDQQELMARVRHDVLPRFAREHLRVIVNIVNAFGGGSAADSAPIQYIVSGPDLDKLARYSQAILHHVERVPGVVDADTTLVVGKPEYVVAIDRERAADLGVSVADVATTLRLMVGGVRATTYNEGSEQYEVHVRAAEMSRVDPASIERLTVPAGMSGRTVRLSDVVHIHRGTGPALISRFLRQRQVTIYCNTVPGASEASIIDQFRAAARDQHMEAGYRGDLSGRSRELGKAATAFAIAFFLSFAFMYLVLAAQFESWIHPITILMALPLTIPFALLSLVTLGQSLNIFSTLGILVLFGIVKKNSILQVDHMRDLRRRGLSRPDAVVLGNRDRLRPILMTTVAFVAGMVPLVLSSGAGQGTNRAMGSVIIGGQTLSLFLTLLATPVVFSWFDDLAHSRFVVWIKRALGFVVGLFDRIFEPRKSKPEEQGRGA